MGTTRQERMVIGLLVVLVAVGAGSRAVRRTAPVDWNGADSTAAVPADLEARTDALTRGDAAAAVPLAPGERIDLNRATAAELRRLPRVSRGMAGRIIAYRTEHGPFRTLADLDSVPGIGPATLARLAPAITLPAPTPQPRAALAVRSTPQADAGAVDLNHATAAELDALPGIGPALAARIVAERTAKGPFRTPDEVVRVSGIGPRLLERIRPQIRAAP